METETKKIPFFKKLYYSIVNFKSYPNMVREGVGKAFLYLLLFTLIFGTISGFIVGKNVTSGINMFISQLDENTPDFRLANGHLEVEGNMPIVLEELPNNQALYIIDTTGQTQADILDNYQTGMLILEDRAIVKQNPVQTSVYDFKEFVGADLTKDDLMNMMPFFKSFGLIFGFLTFLFFYLVKMFHALLLAVIGLLIAAIQSKNLSFGKQYSLGIYVLTLPVLLDIIISLFGYNFPWYLFYLVGLIYMWFAIREFDKPMFNMDDNGEIN